MYVVQLEPFRWIAGDGDTIFLPNAEKFADMPEASQALRKAREVKPYPEATIDDLGDLFSRHVPMATLDKITHIESDVLVPYDNRRNHNLVLRGDEVVDIRQPKPQREEDEDR